MNSRGLTLIEIMVAMTIAVVLFAAVAMSVGAITGSKAKEATGELAGTIRYLYDTASLTGKTCRLVFDLPKEKDEDGKVTYWAECAAGNITTSRDREEELKTARKEKEDLEQGKEPQKKFSDGSAFTELMAREQNRVEDQAKFSDFTDEQVEKREFPTAVRVNVWTKQQRDEVKDGLAYLYFFPQGYTERAMVKVRQGDNTWTIKVEPLTGKANIVPEDLEIPRS